jgi:hypothetical protein
MIADAYGVREFTVFDGPPWARNDRYDIEARTSREVSGDEIRQMLQRLLSTRLGVAVRTEPRRIQTSFRGRSMSTLVGVLTNAVQAPVIDETRLDGRYDVELEWLPPSATSRDDQLDAASLFTAVREQLGLSLTPETRLQDVLVIQRASRPSPN